jgi:hypothetical protein
MTLPGKASRVTQEQQPHTLPLISGKIRSYTLKIPFFFSCLA